MTTRDPRCAIMFSPAALELPSAIRRNVERCHYDTRVRTHAPPYIETRVAQAMSFRLLISPRSAGNVRTNTHATLLLRRDKTCTGNTVWAITIIAPRRQRSTLPENIYMPMGVFQCRHKFNNFWQNASKYPNIPCIHDQTGGKTESWLELITTKKKRRHTHICKYIYIKISIRTPSEPHPRF